MDVRALYRRGNCAPSCRREEGGGGFYFSGLTIWKVPGCKIPGRYALFQVQFHGSGAEVGKQRRQGEAAAP